MDTNSGAPTAKIYQFPVTTSGDLGKRGLQAPPAADVRQSPLPTIQCASGWYHETAMEADRLRKS